MKEEERLGPKLRTLLQDVIPEPAIDGSLLAGARARVRQRRRMVAAETSLGVAALAAAVIVPTALLSSGSGEPTATGSSSASATKAPAHTDTAPAWAARCFLPMVPKTSRPPATATPFGRPAPQFVGMSRDEIEQQAAKKHFHVVIVGAGGHCQPVVFDLVATNHVFLAFDSHDQVVAAREDGYRIRRR